MSRTFAGLSGTYNVRANELALQKNTKSIRCLVYFLDDTQHVFEVDRRSKGQHLLDVVFRHLELIERDYFGLQFSDSGHRHGHLNANSCFRWLDANKRIRKQLKSGAPYLLFFKVKFYVTEPSRLLEEYTRYHFFLQIRKDIVSGKLVAPTPALAVLASYVVQSELGDYCAEEHTTGYVSGLKLVPEALQTADFEQKVCDVHRLHRGQTPADAELNYLDRAKSLDMYGIELHRAKDTNGQDIQIGVSGNGLLILEKMAKVNQFSWAKIIKISFKRRHFFIQLRREGTERFDNLLGFNLQSYRSCKALWKSCVEQHTFFRLQTPKPHTKKFFFFFSLGSKFRYSGKTEFQTLEENKKRLTRTERTFIRTRTSRFTRQTVPIPHISNLMLSTAAKVANGAPAQTPSPSTATVGQHRPYDSFSHPKIQTSESPSRTPRSAWLSLNSNSSAVAYCPTQVSLKSLPFIDKDSSVATEPSAHSPPHRLSSLSEDSSPVHLVAIQMRPDEDGRFGFNVKGGYDQNCPVLVSRVAPNTPADNASPKLREGDQVMAINGKDVSGLSHEQIVQLIRSTRDCGPEAELVLSIRPNVYSRDGVLPEEPDFQYIPADVSPTSAPNGACDPLQESMMLLNEGLESGSLVQQFEQLSRKKSGEPMSAARMADNLCKNRYRDISPYDSTRVVLNDSLCGDYINASFVSMHIPTTEVVNSFIATQGPLRETAEDFWLMVWEQRSPLVVMVTPLEEKGRNKCHKYWPEDNEELVVYGLFSVHLMAQTGDCAATVERRFQLRARKGVDERQVTHLQYLAWPDHGVPDRDHDFLELIRKVRQVRLECAHPLVVHCSAGIGRTGVLILMETGMCLIEANQAVYPLDLVRTMRDQRAMLIQTSSQFRFVCSALFRVWADKVVQPLRA